MTKANNNYNGLLKTLNSNKQLSGTVTPFSERSLAPGRIGGSTATSLGGKNLSAGISFGKLHTTKTPAASAGSDWTKFLEQGVSKGLVSAFSSSFGLGDLTGGIGSLISGISSLFGGNKQSPTPLVGFHLPAAQNQTITVGANGTSGLGSTTTSMQDQSAQIAQAVKTALLHSSSLNDVISEI